MIACVRQGPAVGKERDRYLTQVRVNAEFIKKFDCIQQLHVTSDSNTSIDGYPPAP